jgi:hypothetical protein
MAEEAAKVISRHPTQPSCVRHCIVVALVSKHQFMHAARKIAGVGGAWIFKEKEHQIHISNENVAVS